MTTRYAEAWTRPSLELLLATSMTIGALLVAAVIGFRQETRSAEDPSGSRPLRPGSGGHHHERPAARRSPRRLHCRFR